LGVTLKIVFYIQFLSAMKLATYKDGSRDGQLVVVSRDLAWAHYATGTANTLQAVLDDWNFLSPQLEDLSVSLNQNRTRHAFAFDPARCMAPLPRIYQWAKPAGRSLVQQSGGDDFLPIQQGIPLAVLELAYLTADVPPQPSTAQLRDALRLAVHVAPEDETGRIRFAPVAMTLDELGDSAKALA
jgi:fumarylacetoacetate (FAA) hydrolase